MAPQVYPIGTAISLVPLEDTRENKEFVVAVGNIVGIKW